jgi:serine/threonine protein kinase
MTHCQCLTKTGKACKNKPQEGSKFCHIHRNCGTKRATRVKSPTVKKPQEAKFVSSSRPKQLKELSDWVFDEKIKNTDVYKVHNVKNNKKGIAKPFNPEIHSFIVKILPNLSDNYQKPLGFVFNNDVKYIVYEYIEGEDLFHWSRHEHSLKERKQMVYDVANILRHFHSMKLTHGDFKPGNFIVSNNKPIMIDFDSSCLTNERGKCTHQHSKAMTFIYSSPERLMNSFNRFKDDVYALAATAYLIMTKKKLFKNEEGAILMAESLDRIKDENIREAIERGLLPEGERITAKDFTNLVGKSIIKK